MATAAEIQVAYKAVYRADLNLTVAQAIAATGISVDAYVAQELPKVASTTQAAVAIASFVTGTAPTSDKLDALKVEADKQVASYTALGVGNPSLGAYEAFGRSFATDSTTTAGFNTKYGALSTSDFINLVYAQVYGSTPSAGAAANLSAQITYFTNLYTANGVANASLAAKGAVLGQIVGYAFVSSASASSNLDNQVQSLLTSAAKGDSSVYNKALPTVVDPGQVGVTITITGAETVSTTAADPAFKSTAFNDTITGVYTTAKIDAGAGEDTLKVTFDSAATVRTLAAGDLVGVENINLTTTTGGVTTVSGFNLENITGVKSVGFTYGAATVGTEAGAFTGLASDTSLFITDTDTASNTKNVTFALKTDTSADVANLTLNGVTNNTVTLTGYETVNLTATGNNVTGVTITDASLKALNLTATKNVGLTLTSATALESVVATGAGSVGLGALAATVKSVDASGLTGATGLTFTSANANALETLKLSGGADDIQITTTGKALAVDLGAGNDKLTYNQTNTSASSVFGAVVAGAGADELILSNNGSATTAFSTQKVTLGAGADKVTLTDNGTNVQTTLVYAAGDSTSTFKDQITGFKAAGDATTLLVADKIDLSAFAMGTITVAYTTAALPVADAPGLFTGNNVIAYGDGTNTTLLIDSNKDGAFNLGTDTVIQLAGQVDHTKVTAVNFITA